MMLISPLPVTPPGAGVAPFWWYSALLSTIISVSISIYSMFLHLKNYRRPQVQRLTIRILWMVPVYAVASFISLSSTSIADFVDTIRDIYEAFVIYSFFMLCVNYLGGERALLSTLEERMRTHHLWPFNLCFAPMDMSDPDTFLFVRRGVLQFVVLKPLIALVTMVLKFAGYYHEGQLTFSGAYLWVSAIYNLSVCWSLYCLVLFYVQCEIDLRPYRPMPKFICVKSVVFLTWYQGLGLAFLVWAGVIKETDSGEGPSRAAVIQDLLICLEMPLLALLHQFAFPWTDYNDSRLSSRVLFPYAVRDAIGIKDIIQDAYHTFKGTTFRDIHRHYTRPWWGTVAEYQPIQIRDGRRRQRNRSRRRRVKVRTRGKMSGGYGTLDGNDAADGRGRQGLESGSAQRWTAEDNVMSGGNHSDHDSASDYSRISTSRSPIRRTPSEASSLGTALSFTPPGFDADLEQLYEQSRTMPYGDYNYPVLHEDDRFIHPPSLRQDLIRRERDYLRRVEEKRHGVVGGLPGGYAIGDQGEGSMAIFVAGDTPRLEVDEEDVMFPPPPPEEESSPPSSPGTQARSQDAAADESVVDDLPGDGDTDSVPLVSSPVLSSS